MLWSGIGCISNEYAYTRWTFLLFLNISLFHLHYLDERRKESGLRMLFQRLLRLLGKQEARAGYGHFGDPYMQGIHFIVKVSIERSKNVSTYEVAACRSAYVTTATVDQ